MKLIEINGVRGYIDDNGTAQLNLEDVSRGLGFTQIANSGNEVVRWERVNKYLTEFKFVPTSGDGTFIPENIFYRMAMKARNETAEIFQAKVADEILPTIRKHGAYMTPETIEKTLTNPDFIIQLATQLKEANEDKAKLQSKIETDKSLVMFAETCLTSERSLLVREVAKLASKNGVMIGEKRLYNKLRDWELMFKNRNEPTQRAMEMGLFEIRKGITQTPKGALDFATPKVTVKGQMYIINRLKNETA